MSLSWHQRKTRLASLLKSHGDEDADALALDRLLHGQNVIGKTSKTTEIDALRFQDKDLDIVGTLEYGQFGVIDVVTCRLDGRVYIRKSIEKRFALRTRDQCSPQFERDILLQAVKTDTRWAPHLLAAFQTPTHLNLVMDYAEGGTLWDVLESSPHNGRVLESDLKWWVPQIVTAIHWCHSQGFAHRDIKPHNFVLTPEARILLIDFGSAAPLLPPGLDGSQRLPKRYCLVPCGTCDYISPEILQSHEEALLALEMDDEDISHSQEQRLESDGYGVETDWWSLGAMLYEMAYGVAPFFANDIRQTYLRIMSHEKSLRFDQSLGISPAYQHFLRRLLTQAEYRLGRRNIMEITDHPVFEDVNWGTIHTQPVPLTLHLPQFTYTEPKTAAQDAAPDSQHQYDESLSQGYAFSALFQSSKASSSPGLSIFRPSPIPNAKSSLREDPSASFIGFSWGPTVDIFPSTTQTRKLDTPRSLRIPSTHITPGATFFPTPTHGHNTQSTPTPSNFAFSTPNRPYTTPYHAGTLPRTSTIRRTSQRRVVSDREAMKQLVDCVGMSARKKVVESGRKPRVLTSSFSRGGGTLKRGKELRFNPSTTPIPVPDYSLSKQPRLAPLVVETALYSGSEAEMTESEGPPSPSPSPRPGSAMSRRSGTPTLTMTMTGRSSTPSLTGTFFRGSNSMTGFLNLPLSAQGGSFASSSSLLSMRRPSISVSGGDLSRHQPIDDRRKDDVFEEMEERHEKIMGRLKDIEQRLEQVYNLAWQRHSGYS